MLFFLEVETINHCCRMTWLVISCPLVFISQGLLGKNEFMLTCFMQINLFAFIFYSPLTSGGFKLVHMKLEHAQ